MVKIEKKISFEAAVLDRWGGNNDRKLTAVVRMSRRRWNEHGFHLLPVTCFMIIHLINYISISKPKRWVIQLTFFTALVGVWCRKRMRAEQSLNKSVISLLLYYIKSYNFVNLMLLLTGKAINEKLYFTQTWTFVKRFEKHLEKHKTLPGYYKSYYLLMTNAEGQIYFVCDFIIHNFVHNTWRMNEWVIK